MKKWFKYIIYVFLLMMLLIIIYCALPDYFTDKHVLFRYYKMENDEIGFQDWASYRIYYYKNAYDIKFKNSKYYTKVNKEIKEHLETYFEDFNVWEITMLDNNIISYNDYVYIETLDHIDITDKGAILDSYRIYLYDIEKHTLYRLEANN